MIEKQITILDGAMGTMLQASGLKLGVRPETLSITNPELIKNIHRMYIDAGSEMILTNTFCANAHKLAGTGYTVEEVVKASIRNAREASENARVLLDIGPIGELMAPVGTMHFETAYDLFKEILIAGEQAGADGVLFETFSDLAEIRVGILAAKECTSLPIFATMTFEENGRTFLGCDAGAAAMTLGGLGIEALGINCSIGPEACLRILKEMRKYTDLPLILKPNAGLPDPQTGEYRMTPESFVREFNGICDLGVAYIGGCCGTSPAFIKGLSRYRGQVTRWEASSITGICSASRCVLFDSDIHPIGERINPTGKKAFAASLLEGDSTEAERRAVIQEEAGAEILDINVGVPGIDETAMMKKVVLAVSGISALPLQIDSSNPEALEIGLRMAPGKSLINSVNASKESLEKILPLAKKYGAAIVALTMDGRRLPEDDKERIVYAQRIIKAAEKAGIDPRNLCIDCLTMTVSAQQSQALHTLNAMRALMEMYPIQSVLGVSNISFGLPERGIITTAFLSQALAYGLTMPIINPNQSGIMEAIDAARVIRGSDRDCMNYVAKYADRKAEKTESRPSAQDHMTIEEAVKRGQKETAVRLTQEALLSRTPIELANDVLIPVLDEVGKAYEENRIFLPQLMNAAGAAGAAFDVIREKIQASGESAEKKGPIVLATVEGDIHDIGKNIVHAVLENYGYRVIDLGKDVPPAVVCESAKKNGAKLIGLSALMTTTVPSMERTITALHKAQIEIPVVVGGAVLTPEYAEKIGADYYAKDAKQTADIAKAIIG